MTGTRVYFLKERPVDGESDNEYISGVIYSRCAIDASTGGDYVYEVMVDFTVDGAVGPDGYIKIKVASLYLSYVGQ